MAAARVGAGASAGRLRHGRLRHGRLRHGRLRHGRLPYGPVPDDMGTAAITHPDHCST